MQVAGTLTAEGSVSAVDITTADLHVTGTIRNNLTANASVTAADFVATDDITIGGDITLAGSFAHVSWRQCYW
jgi:hypothetical protein